MSQLLHLGQHQKLNIIHISCVVADDKGSIEVKASLVHLNLPIVKGLFFFFPVSLSYTHLTGKLGWDSGKLGYCWQ